MSFNFHSIQLVQGGIQRGCGYTHGQNKWNAHKWTWKN